MQGFAGAPLLSSVMEIGGANVSAFGTIETGELTPVVQLDFLYGINAQTGQSAASGTGATVDTNSSRLRLQCGTGAAGSAQFNSRKIIRYRAGLGTTARFTAVFANGTTNNTQIVGCGSSTNGYFFGYNGTAFGILHRNNGVDTWIAQTSWNGDQCLGLGGTSFTIAPGFGNVYQIKYPYLGYGTIKFYILDPGGAWLLVHTIRYPNTVITTQLSNPSLQFYAQSVNSGNTTNLTMYVGSVGIFVSGPRTFTSNPRWAADNSKTGITTETCLLNLRNCTSYNGVTNRALIRLNAVTFGSTAAHMGVLRFKLNATIGGAPSYTPTNGTTGDNGVTLTAANSVASVDVAGTTVAAGTYIFNLSNVGGTVGPFDLTPLELYLAPGDILTVSGTNTNASEMGVSLNWSEDV